MKLNRVLIVYKGGREAKGPIDADDDSVMGFRASHEKTLFSVQDALQRRGIPFDSVDRTFITADHGADLIVTVGGDGTALAAAQVAGSAPILAINSMPGHSVGNYCMITEGDFEGTLAQIISDEVRATPLPLIEIAIDGIKLPTPALNDILFAASSPVKTVRYTLTIGDRSEFQKSSGIWIASGPGSTAAINSAGGEKRARTSRELQYLVREPCTSGGALYDLKRGFAPGAKLSIESRMSDAMAYIDGSKIVHEIPKGGILTASISEKEILLFI